MFCKTPDAGSMGAARSFFYERRIQCEGAAPRIALHPDSISFSEARKVVGDAFGGKTASDANAMTMSVLEPMGVGSDERTKDRQELARFCLGFFAYELLHKGGMALGVKDDGGALRAVTIFREYDAEREDRVPSFCQKISSAVVSMRAYLAMKSDPVGLPSFLSDKEHQKTFQGIVKKLEPLWAEFHDWHSKHGPPGPHWYVGIVASDPDTQGMGYCKEVMKLLSSAADECGMRCYLECKDSERLYYEKFGFVAMEGKTIRINDRTLPSYIMTRPCKGEL